MQLKHLKALLSLTGKATGRRHGVAWKPRLGRSVEVAWGNAETVLYSVTFAGITQALSGVNPELHLLDGSVVPDGAVVTRGEEDFEGFPLPSMAGVLGILLERLDAQPNVVLVKEVTTDQDHALLAPGCSVLHVTDQVESPQIGIGLEVLQFICFGVPDGEIQVRATVLALRDTGA